MRYLQRKAKLTSSLKLLIRNLDFMLYYTTNPISKAKKGVEYMVCVVQVMVVAAASVVAVLPGFVEPCFKTKKRQQRRFFFQTTESPASWLWLPLPWLAAAAIWLEIIEPLVAAAMGLLLEDQTYILFYLHNGQQHVFAFENSVFANAPNISSFSYNAMNATLSVSQNELKKPNFSDFNGNSAAAERRQSEWK